jgi:hypothetical protein
MYQIFFFKLVPRCFLKKWASYGASEENWDNGDLLQLLMDIIDPGMN